MKTVATSCVRIVSLTAVLSILSLGLTGCAYRMYAPHPPSQERIRIIAKFPDHYVVHVDVGHVTDYPVPNNGRVIVGVPGFRPSCGVYLFNTVKVGGSEDPLGTWTITVSSGSRTLHKMSIKQASKLATDAEGYRLFNILD